MRIFDGRIFDDRNTVIGYVENETLYAIDADGYADAVCTIEHPSEIIGRLKEWISNHRPLTSKS